MSTSRKSEDKKSYSLLINEENNLKEIVYGEKIPDEVNLYHALEKIGLLKKANGGLGLGHLVRPGELGLMTENGVPSFLEPGRHILWSPTQTFHGVKSIVDTNLIKLNNIQIVTINQGELGLSQKNGINIILQPGRYLLEAPHKFVKRENINIPYVELGTYRRITVPAGHVAIAYENGKQFIIPAAKMNEGPYETNSPTFSFDPRNGFQVVQLQVVELEKLTVTTREIMITITVEGLINYKIDDPKTAFFEVKDVHKAVKRQAEATLTSVFAHLSLDQLASSLSSASIKNRDSFPEENLIHAATDLFLREFTHIAKGWGVTVLNLNIEKMEFLDKVFLTSLRERAQKRLITETDLANVDAQNEVQIKKAQANAEATQIEARARVFVAEKELERANLLSQNPLSTELAILNAQRDIAEKMSDKTIFVPHNLCFPPVYNNGNSYQPFLFKSLAAENNKTPNQAATLEATPAQEVRASVSLVK